MRRTPDRIAAWIMSLHVVILLAILVIVGGVTWATANTVSYQVSQRGRDFQPSNIAVRRGEIVRIINDDADLLHHAFIKSDKFNFDSADMAPGSKVDIKFSVPGEFNVLCGIHPKMKLTVQVN
jgi:plastocyanin